MLALRLRQGAVQLLPGEQAADLAPGCLLHLLLHREHGFERLVHGGAVALLHPPGKPNKLGPRRNAPRHNPSYLLQFTLVVFRPVGQLHHIPFAAGIARPEGYVDLLPGPKPAHKRLRHPVLKGPIHTLMGDIYDNIGKSLPHLRHLSVCSGMAGFVTRFYHVLDYT